MSNPVYPRWHDELVQLERAYFGRLVDLCNGSQQRIADVAGIPRGSIRAILDRCDLYERSRELRRLHAVHNPHAHDCLSWDRGSCDCHRSQPRAAE